MVAPFLICLRPHLIAFALDFPALDTEDNIDCSDVCNDFTEDLAELGGIQ